MSDETQRAIVLDTETTGLRVEDGHRVLEIGAVELIGNMPTGQTRQWYINPERNVDAEAVAVHGLTNDFLMDKPVFRDVAVEFTGFIGDARIIAHNAEFDIKFLNAELAALDIAPIAGDRVIDTLKIARKRFPGSPATLDALCRRFRISTESRSLHGALLDSRILAEVYMELLEIRAPKMDLGRPEDGAGADIWRRDGVRQRVRPIACLVTEGEASAHAAFLDEIAKAAKAEPLWRLGSPEAA
jgi:DNA polymerase-3 subunit epsilon